MCITTTPTFARATASSAPGVGEGIGGHVHDARHEGPRTQRKRGGARPPLGLLHDARRVQVFSTGFGVGSGPRLPPLSLGGTLGFAATGFGARGWRPFMM